MKKPLVIPALLILLGAGEAALSQHAEQKTLPENVREYVGNNRYDADYSELADFYDSGVTPELIDMLESLAAEDMRLPRVVGLLGIVGDEQAVEPLIALIEKPSAQELSISEAESRRVAILSLGLLVNHTGNEQALSYLIDGLTPVVWRQRDIQGVDIYTRPLEQYYALLSTYAIFGLALSGYPRARDALLSLKQSPSTEQSHFRIGLDSTLDQWLEVQALVAERGVSGMYEYYRTQGKPLPDLKGVP